MIAGVRLALAFSGLLIIWLDPVEPDRLAPVTYAALVSYTLYSVFIGALVLRAKRSGNRILAWSHWVDVASYSILVALSSGTNSIFFFGFFFAIIASSFRFGYKTGLRITVVSALSFTAVSLATSSLSPHFELNRFLLRSIDLAVVGYMISYWGGYQLRLSQRLALLKDVAGLSNPRFGVDRTIGSILEKLRAFYVADACVFVSIDPQTSEFRLRRADRRDPGSGTRSEVIDPHLANQLVHLLGDQTVVYRDPTLRPWRMSSRSGVASDRKKGEPNTDVGLALQTAANLLDASSFVTVPLRQRDKTLGRVYVTSRTSRSFDRTDAAFLAQVSEHVVSVLQHTRLIDRLATEAADQERKRIARDIHDSIIQPYIGLQMGLAGVRRRLSTDLSDVNGNDRALLKIVSDAASDTDRLIEMTANGISDLRGYVHVLREKGDSEDSLMPALRRFAAKFTQATNIIVQVRADTDIQVDDRIGAEVFQVIVEGLSNIRRHTQSERAFIGLECSDKRLTLRVENDGTRGLVPEPFTPRSIAERAKSLGGRVHVETFGDAGTSVIVEIPL
jgi:signal transduction histidine kinase